MTNQESFIEITLVKYVSFNQQDTEKITEFLLYSLSLKYLQTFKT